MRHDTLRTLMGHYRNRNQLSVPPDSAPTLLWQVQRSLKAIPDELPGQELARRLVHFRAMPLLGQLEIYRHIVEHGTVSEDQRKNLRWLEARYQALQRTRPYQQVMATDLEERRIKVVRFNPHRRSRKDLEFILLQNGACYAGKRDYRELVEAFYDDGLIGGSVIFTVETTRQAPWRKIRRKTRGSDNPIHAAGKLMFGLDKRGRSLATLDHYSNSNYVSRHVQEWLDEGKIHFFAYGPATALYLAEQLGIERLALTDSEMEEFGRACGVGKAVTYRNIPTRNTGQPDERKLGVVARPDNMAGIWQHSLYHNSDGRVVTLDVRPLSLDALYDEFVAASQRVQAMIGDKTKLYRGYQKRLHLSERFDVMHCLLRVMEDAFLGRNKFNRAKINYNHCIGLVKERAPDFARQYVK